MKTNSLSAWILAVRPYSLGNSVILVLIGSALAWTDYGFHWLPAVLCLAFALLMQCTANLVNDLWDFLKGADQPDRLGPDRAFAKGYITLRAMKAGIAGFTLAACAAGVALLVWALHAGVLRYGGWELVAAGAACIVFAWFYTAGPYPLAYHGLGDVAVILFFGWSPWVHLLHPDRSVDPGGPRRRAGLRPCDRHHAHGQQLPRPRGGRPLQQAHDRRLPRGQVSAAGLSRPGGRGRRAVSLAALHKPHVGRPAAPALPRRTYRHMAQRWCCIDHGDALNVCLGETARNILLFGALFTLGILLGR